MKNLNKITSIALIFTVIGVMACHDAYGLRVPMGEKISRDRMADLIKIYSDIGQLHFVSSNDIQVPEFSLRRALMHRFESWKDDRVFKIPLTISDHFILTVLPAIVSISVIIGYASLLFMDFLGWQRFIFLAIAFVPVIDFEFKYIDHALSHVKETQDGRAVFYNSKRYLENPSIATIDKSLLMRAAEFQKLTGWEVVWTDSPYILAWPQPEQKRVIMTIGWVLVSNKEEIGRRPTYFVGILRRIRHAIENADKAKKPISLEVIPMYSNFLGQSKNLAVSI